MALADVVGPLRRRPLATVPRIVLTDLAVFGRWTWTHGGGPGASVLPVRTRTRTGRARPVTAGAVGALAFTGAPSEDDGLRDGQEPRPWTTGRFHAELIRTGSPFAGIAGAHRLRSAVAVASVDAPLAHGRHLTAPLPETP
ncbi:MULTISPECIES: hypothetical protein [unclassified Streptomyces]|uniref:hypothetical protein n=1 Tax=unclassified Streptomyces TaxID=2593676 RepID=UPI0001C18FBF|nr:MULTISPECIES: hypothetical protein [unclassified Streptomyces]PZX30936.1 hypothetical protein K373_06289 [Streptomyces sp. DvalAA-21]RAJ26822.1 hypothetical protein K351_06234 [Streptomyces sp. DpondAA-E10]RAJ40287.1 hypothetical protein K352_06227 [Streptomyces sp. DpondAA-A50]SCE53859.1 hypothetical protein GA0115235_12397 [Streptomyces sp. DpondAA-F4a]SCM08596.1 hypothetical protein SAMN04883147_107423 [Streptomyces sp. DpondAA-F4]